MAQMEVGMIDIKGTPDQPQHKASIGLRPYFDETDRKYVHYLFYSTYFNLVPATVWRRLRSPYVLTPWVVIYAVLITVIPSMLAGSYGLLIATRLMTTMVWIAVGVIGLVWYVDKFDISARVVEGIENDLKHPDIYYRGTPDAIKNGQFWVLTLNNEIVGCVGMDETREDVYDAVDAPYIRASERPRAVDSPEIQNAQWKTTARVMAQLDDMVRLTLVGIFDIVRDIYLRYAPSPHEPKLLFKAHKPNEGSVRRLAIKTECQGHGLSTVLLKRVAFWAHAHQIEYLYAEVDDMQSKLGEILTKRHGYTQVEHKKLGLFRTKTVYRLDVKLWMSHELEKRATENEAEAQKKEEEELKEYS